MISVVNQRLGLREFSGLFFILILFAACDRSAHQSTQLLEIQGETMGTTYTVKYYPGPTTPSLPELRGMIDGRLKELNQHISTYIPNSTISKFNQDQSTSWHNVNPQFIAGLEIAEQVHQATGGTYDPTVGPLVNLWGFGPGPKRMAPPSDQEIQAARERVGLDKLEIDRVELRIRKRHPELYLDFSSLGQGMGMDMMRDILERYQIKNYLVNIGGEYTTKGKKTTGPWKIAVEAPHQERGVVQRIVELGDRSICTSGNYRQFFESGGKRYAHTIDPSTGIPVQHKLISASVIDESSSALTADTWATALLSVGPERAQEMAEKNALAAFFIVETDQGLVERFSSRWLELFPDSVVEGD